MYTSQKLEKEDIIRFGITGKSFIRAAWLAESSQKPQGSLLEKLTHVRQLAWAHRSLQRWLLTTASEKTQFGSE